MVLLVYQKLENFLVSKLPTKLQSLIAKPALSVSAFSKDSETKKFCLNKFSEKRW